MQDGFAAVDRTAQQRLYPRDQLDDRERFCEVIISAHSQSAHPVVHRAERTQDENGRPDLVVAKCLDDGQPIHSRQHAIDDHGIGARHARAVEAVDAVGGPMHLEPAVGKLGDNRLGGLGVVLDQENPVHDPRSTFHAASRRAVGARGLGDALGHVRCPCSSNARP